MRIVCKEAYDQGKAIDERVPKIKSLKPGLLCIEYIILIVIKPNSHLCRGMKIYWVAHIFNACWWGIFFAGFL
jgi:hypothetical protein